MTLRRWLAVLLLVLLPLQVSFAAWHEYADHAADAGDSKTALFHSHDQHDHDSDTGNGADPHEHGLGHIHLDHAQFLAASFALLTVDAIDARIAFKSGAYPSLFLQRLDRPPLRARL